MSKTLILTAFNDSFVEFVTDFQSLFPDDYDLLVAKNSLLALKKSNPRLLLTLWDTHIVGKYKNEIEKGNLDFFINKDYTQDINATSNSSQILSAIDKFRKPIKNLTENDKSQVIKYIQNLTKLCSLYIQYS
jgi:hypothetical protein